MCLYLIDAIQDVHGNPFQFAAFLTIEEAEYVAGLAENNNY